jgi:hypothetical protein
MLRTRFHKFLVAANVLNLKSMESFIMKKNNSSEKGRVDQLKIFT